jgi:hypothetical protein
LNPSLAAGDPLRGTSRRPQQGPTASIVGGRDGPLFCRKAEQQRGRVAQPPLQSGLQGYLQG